MAATDTQYILTQAASPRAIPSAIPIAIPAPIHCFEFDAINAARLADTCSDAQWTIDRFVPVQGHTGPAMACGKAAALLVTWPVRHSLPNQPKQPALPDLAPPWTLALWLRRDATTAGSSLLSSRRVAIKLEQWATEGKLGLTRFDVADWHCAASLPLGRWCHLTLVATPSRTDFYIDGQLAGSIDASIELPRGWVGSSAGWTEFCEASLGQMQFYDQALGPAMVQQLASATPLTGAALQAQDGAQQPLEATDLLDFGTVTDNAMASLQIQLHNTSPHPLLITPHLRELPEAEPASGVQAAETAAPAPAKGKARPAAQFSLELLGSRLIAPGASTRLICHFMARYLGTRQAELVIESNDASLPLRTLRLQATADVPIPLPAMQVALADTAVADGQARWLGQVPLGTRKVWLLALTNRGTAALELRLRISGSRQFTCWQGAGPHTVPPGGVFCADLAFAADSLDDARATLSIFSNDPDLPEFRCKLQAAGSQSEATLQINQAPLLEACATPLQLGAIAPGQSLRHVIIVKNTGQSVATLAQPPRLVNSRCKSFRLDAPALTQLPPGATLALPIIFTPKSGGAKRARVQLAFGQKKAELHLEAHADQV